MAYSKTFLFVGLLFAVVLILSSEVSARELAETAETLINVEDEKHGGYGHGHDHEKGHGHNHEKGHGHGEPGHGGAGEDVEDETEGAKN
ncbi:hypothetical protein PVL29_025748 [Vitis rotundifolia]|uniref:Phase-change related protein n=1 Tax=Vitis rotundifolia TaxID=103349 RepID=A0AA38YKU5_VITRO|nr:hypothetical protein PVL29_025748 [Vitis rotundifolia]